MFDPAPASQISYLIWDVMFSSFAPLLLFGADVLFCQSWVSVCVSNPSASVFLSGWGQVVSDSASPPCFGPLG